MLPRVSHCRFAQVCRRLLPVVALSLGACVSSAPAPELQGPWYVGKFTGGPYGKNAKQVDLLCSPESSCRVSMGSLVLGQVPPLPADPAAANRALGHARSVYAGKRPELEEKYKQDLALLRPLLEGKEQAEACVDVGSIRNLFFLCRTSADPQARQGGILLGATLEPTTEAACRDKLYCGFYVVPVLRK
ncbi:MAG: hypothetical protein RIR00_1740 [Pseudomonadota bacterium]